MRQVVVVIFMAAVGILLLTGCQESEGNQIRKARLVANENLELKELLGEKDQQIEGLKKQIEDMEIKSAKEHEEFGNLTLKTLQMLAESENQNQALTLEIEQLSEELEKLKAQ